MPFRWYWLLVAGGLVLLVIGAAVAFSRWRFSKRKVTTTGTVAKMDADSSGEWAIVRFVVDGVEQHVGSAFRSNHNPYTVGEAVPVDYDPTNPKRAVLRGPKEGSSRNAEVAALLGSALLLLVAGGILAAVVPGVERRAAARDRALQSFLDLVRRGDLAAARRTAAPHAKLDEAFLQSTARTSLRFTPYRHTIEHGECVGGYLTPSNSRMYAKLVETKGGWKVLRVGASDPECEKELDD